MSKRAVFIGDSITQGFNFDEFFPGFDFINKGISGFSSGEILDAIKPDWFSNSPELVFICAGTNDLARSITQSDIINNIDSMILSVLQNSGMNPRIYVTSLFPTRHNHPRPNPLINTLNLQLHFLASKNQQPYLHLNPFFSDHNGQLKREYTDDGLHLTHLGYERWADLLRGLTR